jgi:hypothetical protein
MSEFDASESALSVFISRLAGIVLLSQPGFSGTVDDPARVAGRIHDATSSDDLSADAARSTRDRPSAAERLIQ